MVANGNKCRIKIDQASGQANPSNGNNARPALSATVDDDESPKTVHVDSTLLGVSPENLAVTNRFADKAGSLESVEMETIQRKVHGNELTSSIALPRNGVISATAV